MTIRVWVASLILGFLAADVRAETNALAPAGPVLHEVTDVLLPSGVYNVVTYQAPRDVALKELGLVEAGITGATRFQQADEIRVFTSRKVMEESPKARLWFNTRENAWWYHQGGEGTADLFVLKRGEMLVVYTRASKERIDWKNPLR